MTMGTPKDYSRNETKEQEKEEGETQVCFMFSSVQGIVLLKRERHRRDETHGNTMRENRRKVFAWAIRSHLIRSRIESGSQIMIVKHKPRVVVRGYRNRCERLRIQRNSQAGGGGGFSVMLVAQWCVPSTKPSMSKRWSASLK